MYFSRKFLRVLEILSHEVESKYPQNPDRLSLSVTAWCNYLKLPEEFSVEVMEDFRLQEMNDIFNVFLGEWGNSSIYGRYQKNPDVSKFVNNIENIFSRKKYFTTKFYLLTAFLLVSSAYVYKKFFGVDAENPSPQKRLIENSSLDANTKNKTFADGTQEILVLVINCKHKELILKLRENLPLTTKKSEELYQVTQELWAGSEQTYESLTIQNSFELAPNESELGGSEYDVYFIKIFLSEFDSGFKKGASQLSRLDAFMRLPKIAKEIEVSGRLSSKAYANIGFYSR